MSFKKNKKPPVGPVSASKSRSVVRRGKNNRNAARKKLEKRPSLSSKVEIRKPNETVCLQDCLRIFVEYSPRCENILPLRMMVYSKSIYPI